MLFNSLAFLVFLPIVLIALALAPRHWRNPCLLVAGYFFYGCWDVRFLSLIMLSTALVLFFGGRMVMDGALTLGELVALDADLLVLAQPVADLGFVVNSAGEAVAGGQRIFEVLDAAHARGRGVYVGDVGGLRGGRGEDP